MENSATYDKTISVLICTSPKAGNGSGRERIAELIDALRASDIAAEVTTDIAYVRQRTRRDALANQPPTIVVAAGGDGTLALVAKNTPPATVLVPMPLGTENLVAKQFGYSPKVDSMLDTLLRGHDHAIDAGQANGKLFLVMATCGFDAEVVRAMHLRRRGHINRFSYLRPILRTVRRYSFPPLHVRWTISAEPALGSAEDIPRPDISLADITRPDITCADITCSWAMVFNLPQYAASLPIETAAVGDDGQLDFCGLENGSVISGLRYLGGIITRRHIHWPDVARQRVFSCRITSPARVAYQLDGDYGGHLPLELRVLPKHITLRLPPRP